MTADFRRRVGAAARYAGLGALSLYVVGVLNDHSTALRQIGYYTAVAAALVRVGVAPQRLAVVAREPFARWLAALALAGILAVLVSPAIAYSGWEAYNELGFLVVAALATALLVDGASDAEVLMWASVVAAIDVSIYAIAQYVTEYRHGSAWPVPNIYLHRHYAAPLLWFLPAMLWGLAKLRGRLLAWGGVTLALYLLLLAATGSRAAWYAGIIAIAAWYLALPSARRIGIVVTALVAAALVALWVVPPPIFLEQAMRGLWTAHRIHGAWLPALHLISERPWLGHGYGQELFHAAYNAEVAAHPDWYFRRSLGAHNVFLALGFAGGVVLLATFVGTLIAYFALVASTRSARALPWRATLVAGACSVLGYVVVRGSFETLPFRVCGPALGIALAYAIERRRIVSAASAPAAAAQPVRPPNRPESA